MKVVIASKNPVKIKAAEFGFTTYFPDTQLSIEAVTVPSEVSDQPLTEADTLLGAKNRVENAEKVIPDGDFWIGIEGGIEERSGIMEAFAWVYIKDKNGKIGKGRTGTFMLPQKISELVKQGKELGEADDIVFNQINSKQKQGTVGTLTKLVIDRTEYYKPAVIFALIPFINPDLY